MDLFDIWQSAQQSFSEFEKEMQGVYFGSTEEEYNDSYRVSQFKPDRDDTKKSSFFVNKLDKKQGNYNRIKELLEKEKFELYTSDFLDFWDLYNKSRNKKGTFTRWKKLNDFEVREIMITLPAYIESTPDKKFRKDPQTYLNQRAWENEIIEHGNNKDPYTTSDEELKQIIKNGFGFK